MSILLTGVTGFIGAQVLVRLLNDKQSKHVYVLIRSNRGQSASQRLDQVIIDLFSPADRDKAKTKFLAVAGDLNASNLGLSSDDRTRLVNNLTHVIHCSASTEFAAPIEDLRRTNREGTRQLLELGKDAKANGQFQRFDFVSTAYVAGRDGGIIREEDLDRNQEFSNNYEQSKFETETVARSYRSFFPVTIMRPSIVVGQSKNGYTPHFRVLYWPLKLVARGFVPVIPTSTSSILDVVPADFVADAIVALSKSSKSENHTFHLTSGYGNEITIGELLKDAEEAKIIPKVPKIPIWMFRGVQFSPLRYLLPRSFWEMTEKAAPYTNYLLGTGTRYDNSKTMALLTELGVRRPVWDEYKENIFRFAQTCDWGRIKLCHGYNYMTPTPAISQLSAKSNVSYIGKLAHSHHK